jgi:type I restriction enzyme S subunit
LEGLALTSEDNKWHEMLISEVCESIIDCVNKTAPTSDNVTEFKMIRTTNVKNGKIDLSSVKYVDWDTYKIWTRRSVPQIGDVILTREAPIGEVGMVTTQEKIFLGQRLIQYRANPTLLNPKFLLYSMRSPYMQKQILSHEGTGSTVSHIRVPDCFKFKIKMPSLGIQNQLANILGALDEKIELNNAINRNLEVMAQALFKRWFVDFEFPNEDGEPYKSSGSELEESELGLIPKGWRVGVFQDLISNTLGGDWGKEIPQDNYTKEVSCIRGADIPEIARGAKGKVPQRFILSKNAVNKSLSHGDIIIEISGGSPTQSTGRTAFIVDKLLEKFDSPLICTNFCRVIKPVSGYEDFLYCYLSYLYNEDVFFQYENGTTGIKNLDIGSLFNVHRIAIPTASVLEQYAIIYQRIYPTIQSLGRESDQLSQIRETLLPKLMSGEIRIPVEQL